MSVFLICFVFTFLNFVDETVGLLNYSCLFCGSLFGPTRCMFLSICWVIKQSWIIKHCQLFLNVIEVSFGEMKPGSG